MALCAPFEQTSIDECLLDITEAVQSHPNSPSLSLSLSSSKPRVDSDDQSKLEPNDATQDIVALTARGIALKFQQDFLASTGFICSIGVSQSRTFAKFATSLAKPHGVRVGGVFS